MRYLYKNVPNVTALAAAIGLIVIAISTEAAPGDTAVPGFEASYRVRYGLLRGDMTLRLVPLESGYRYETALRPRGIASWFASGEISERSDLTVAGTHVRPLDYVSEDTIADPERLTRYEFGEQRVTGEFKSQSVNEPMHPGGQNRISVQVAVMHALRQGAALNEIAVFDRARWKTFAFEVIPGQFVSLPKGDLETVEVRYAAADKDREWSLHFAPSLDYLPVLLAYREGGKVKSRAELTTYRLQVEGGRQVLEARPPIQAGPISVAANSSSRPSTNAPR